MRRTKLNCSRVSSCLLYLIFSKKLGFFDVWGGGNIYLLAASFVIHFRSGVAVNMAINCLWSSMAPYPKLQNYLHTLDEYNYL